MKKSFKTLLIAVALACVFAFGACAGTGSGLSGKYDGVVDLYGDCVIAYKDGEQRVFRNGKAKGDKAYQIERAERYGEFFMGKRTATSGWALMDKNGKFLQKAVEGGPIVKDWFCNTVAWWEENKKGVGFEKHEVNYFAVELDVSRETETEAKANKFAIMNTKGEISGRYSAVDKDSKKIIRVEKMEKEGAAAPFTYPVYAFALKEDGATQIGRKIKGAAANDVCVVGDYGGDSVVSVLKETADDNGNNYDVYDKDGKFLSVAFGYAEAGGMVDTNGAPNFFRFMKKNEKGVAELHIINKNGGVEKHADLQFIYIYENAFYAIEGKAEDNSIKLKTLNKDTFATADVTAKGYADYYYSWQYYLRFETADGKYDYMMYGGKEIASGVDKNDSDFSYTYYYTGNNTVDFGYILRNGSKLEAKIAGGEKRTRNLETGETVAINWDSALNGYVVISKAGEYTKLWIPHTNAVVDLSGAPVPNGPNGNVLQMGVLKGGKEYYYGTLTRNIKYWNGELLSGNLLIDVGGLTTEAQLEKDKVITKPAGKFEISNYEAYPRTKAKKYEESDACYAEIDKAWRKQPTVISGGSVTYTLLKGDGTEGDTATFHAFAYGMNDESAYKKLSLMRLGEDEKFDDFKGPFAVTRGTKPETEDISNVYKISVNKKGEPEIKKVLTGLYNAWIDSDVLFNYYICAQAADGTDEVYSDTGKLMLRGGLFHVNEIVNYNAAVYKIDGVGLNKISDYGVIKLNKKGGFKTLAKLEWYAYSFFADGSFLAKAEYDGNYARLYDAGGKLLEKNAAVKYGSYKDVNWDTVWCWMLDGAAFSGDDAYKYNSDRIWYEGAKECIMRYEVVTGGGASKIFTVTIAEKSLDFAIYNVYNGLEYVM